MRVIFTEDGWEDFGHWIKKDRRVAMKIAKLVTAIGRNPYEGDGRPEQLKHELSGCWSRRINQEHRLVYQVDEEEDTCLIFQCRKHY